MDRSAYNKCMVPFMKGGGEDRKLRFCAGAKICSGKAKTEEEARQICFTQPTNPPKARKSKVAKCADPIKLAACIAASADMSKFTNIETFHHWLEAAIVHCSMQVTQPSKPIGYKAFMRVCLKKAGVMDFTKSQPAIKKCEEEWKTTRLRS